MLLYFGDLESANELTLKGACLGTRGSIKGGGTASDNIRTK